MDGKPERHFLLDIREQLKAHQPDQYLQFAIDVPQEASKVGLIFTYTNPFSDTNPGKAVIFVAFFDPEEFRGHRMNPGGRGDVTLELWTAPDSASEGAIPGVIHAGQWRIQMDIRALSADTVYKLQAYYESDPIEKRAENLPYPENHIVKAEPGWYKGELHAHSTESDGKYRVEEVIQAAKEFDLDYFSLTDHTTSSQWHKLAQLQNDKMALIRSLEITSHVGHANLHGISKWVNTYIDQAEWSANQAAEEVHQQGGLFCINHAFSGNLSWRDFDLDWSLVDLEEIYHNLEGANNAYQLALWDQHLNQGYRIVGVGGIDSHNPFEGLHALGQVVTWIYADELSEKGIVEGLKRGKVYISRGPELRFSISNGRGESAEMWESISNAGPLTIQTSVKWHEPLSLFIIKNGQILDVQRSQASEDEWYTNVIVDNNPQDGSYYRVEYHDEGVKMPYKGIIWRDFSTTRILSNPIWVERNLKVGR